MCLLSRWGGGPKGQFSFIWGEDLSSLGAKKIKPKPIQGELISFICFLSEWGGGKEGGHFSFIWGKDLSSLGDLSGYTLQTVHAASE